MTSSYGWDDYGYVPDEGFCFSPISPGAAIRCELPLGHEGLHSNEAGTLLWGALEEVSEPDGTVSE